MLAAIVLAILVALVVLWKLPQLQVQKYHRRYPALAAAELMKGENDSSFTSIKDGGWQVPYEDEDPAIHAEFHRDLEKHGAQCLMPESFPDCSRTHRAGAAE